MKSWQKMCWEAQSVEVQRFLEETSVLRILTPGLCDEILEISSSKEMIAFIAQNDMFITDLGGDEYRYHPIFRTFLYQQLTPERRKALHIRAATNYAHSHELNAAIYHYLQAEDYYSAAELLNRFGGKLHAMGHLETLANYLDHLSPRDIRTVSRVDILSGRPGATAQPFSGGNRMVSTGANPLAGTREYRGGSAERCGGRRESIWIPSIPAKQRNFCSRLCA